ncbi:MarR family protein [Halogranum amylolyticum]|uniref:MarR family protein n=2 Tax=Halogranum amylolyticum TaxID=660520 RepID=A0A1H8N0Z7_9EURY|nr:MarR family protein [Halogranum amylolyticum]
MRTDGNGERRRDTSTNVTVGARPSNGSRSEADLLLEDGVRPRERFVDLMEANDGWLRQQTLVEATQLSQATVSRTLTTMEEEGVVTRRRVGRENVVYLSGREPSDLETELDAGTDGRTPT